MIALLFTLSSLANTPIPLSNVDEWTTKLGFEPSVPAECQPASLGESLLIDCGGTSLVISPTVAAADLISDQAAPFVSAGIVVADPTPVACTMQGGAATCLQTEISIPPGATMTLIGGSKEDSEWAALCLHRTSELPTLCAEIFQMSSPAAE